MHTSRNVSLLSGILAGDTTEEQGRARPPACGHAFRDAFIQTNASAQVYDDASAHGYDNTSAQGYDNASTQGHDNANAQGHGNSRPGCVPGRAATGFTSGLSYGDEDSSGISGDH